jgi:hypothetical protein
MEADAVKRILGLAAAALLTIAAFVCRVVIVEAE